MLFICLNCDYEIEINSDNDFPEEEDHLICPKCGDTVFEVYHVGPCIKSM